MAREGFIETFVQRSLHLLTKALSQNLKMWGHSGDLWVLHKRPSSGWKDSIGASHRQSCSGQAAPVFQLEWIKLEADITVMRQMMTLPGTVPAHLHWAH